MKVLKVFLALIISIVMIGSATLALGSFAVQKASSEESIRSAIDETGIVDDLMTQALEQNTSSMGSLLGSAAKAIAQTEPMENFIAEYMASAIAAEIYGQEREDLSSDALMEAFASGMEIAIEEKGFNISETESEMIRMAMMQTMPMLTDSLNASLDQYETAVIDEHTQEMIDGLRILVSPVFRYGTLFLTLLCAIILVLLFWSSRLGFLWAAVCVFLATCAFGVAALVSDSFGADSMYVDSAERMVYIMCYNGAIFAVIAGAATGMALIILLTIMRLTRRSV
ncbi:MAG: hypothetical protein Q4A65_02765 [Bacillota bacterium]|nr:hypothetical protein [Bacillota bacterium]